MNAGYLTLLTAKSVGITVILCVRRLQLRIVIRMYSTISNCHRNVQYYNLIYNLRCCYYYNLIYNLKLLTCLWRITHVHSSQAGFWYSNQFNNARVLEQFFSLQTIFSLINGELINMDIPQVFFPEFIHARQCIICAINTIMHV